MNIFITYGNERFAEPLRVIRRQARHTGRFDRIRIYRPSDLPREITENMLFGELRGGGYWLWKPWIICDALKRCKIGDVVYYADAGCGLRKESVEWERFEALMKVYDALLFSYRSDIRYKGWEQFCKTEQNNNTKIKHWCKVECSDFFINRYGNDRFLEEDELWSGFVIVKKTDELEDAPADSGVGIMREWRQCALEHSHLFADHNPDTEPQPDYFNIHRHDQVILSIIARENAQASRVCIIPETSESDRDNAAVVARRYRLGKLSPWLALKYRIYNFLHPYVLT